MDVVVPPEHGSSLQAVTGKRALLVVPVRKRIETISQY